MDAYIPYQGKKVRFREPSASSYIPHHSVPLARAEEKPEHTEHVQSVLHRYSDHTEEIQRRRGRSRSRSRKPGGRASSRKRSCSRAVHISVNVRYRGSSNSHLVLRHDVQITVGARHDMWDVWRMAKRQNSKLGRLHVCRKVLATDHRLRKFANLPDRGRVKDVLVHGKRRWIFIVEKPKRTRDCCKCRMLMEGEVYTYGIVDKKSCGEGCRHLIFKSG